MRSKVATLHRILLGVFVFALIIYWPQINLLPIGNHIWAKADFLALAHGFIQNSLDFFHPQTYQLNLQFPSTIPPDRFQGITSADFPIIPYFVALISSVFKGIPMQALFRITTFMMATLASYKIYLVGRATTIGDIKSFLLALLVFLNPGQFIYQFGFQPSPIAFAFSALAMLYMFAALDQNKGKLFYWAALFFTLATLIRTTHILFLGAMGVMLILKLVQGNRNVLRPLMASVLGGLFVVGYYIYNGYLRQRFGSIFLGATMLPQDFNDVVLSIYMIARRFPYYLPIPLLVVVVWKFIELRRLKFHLDLSAVKIPLLYFLIAALFAVLLFYIVMMRQYVHHDYYLLDTFTPLVFSLLMVLSSIKNITFSNKQIVVFVVMMLGLGVSKLWRSNEASKEGRGYQTFENFDNTNAFLDSLGVMQTDKVLVIDAYAPNLPFLCMNRQGYLILTTSKENIERALTWPFDYIVTQNSFYKSDVLANFPQFEQYVTSVQTNGRITVWQLSLKGKEKYPIRYKPETVYW